MSSKKIISFWLDEEKDKDIVAWLTKQRNQSQAIRDALRTAIAPPPALDIGAIRAAVEAALDERLITTTNNNNHSSEPGEDPDLAAALDRMF